ncbi:hypothetical protein D3C87_1686090 [compost metagenome]
MFHVAATDIEGPGQRVRIGDDERVDLRLVERLADALKLGSGVLAGISARMSLHGRCGRGRAIGPEGVDRVR